MRTAMAEVAGWLSRRSCNISFPLRRFKSQKWNPLIFSCELTAVDTEHHLAVFRSLLNELLVAHRGLENARVVWVAGINEEVAGRDWAALHFLGTSLRARGANVTAARIHFCFEFGSFFAINWKENFLRLFTSTSTERMRSFREFFELCLLQLEFLYSPL